MRARLRGRPQRSGVRPRLPPVSDHIIHAFAARAALLRPTSVLVPWSTVIGRSGVLAHGQARHGERCCLFLDAARVGQHDARARAGSPSISR